MAKVGIDIHAEKPKVLTDQAVKDSMAGCPYPPPARYPSRLLTAFPRMRPGSRLGSPATFDSL